MEQLALGLDGLDLAAEEDELEQAGAPVAAGALVEGGEVGLELGDPVWTVVVLEEVGEVSRRCLDLLEDARIKVFE